MNRSNNERYRETEARIIDAFTQLLAEKELPDITVSELCRISGIHRTSFYLHFQDVYDLMDRVEESLARYYAQVFEEDRGQYDLGERFLHLFRFIAEHQRFYQTYWRRSKDLRVLDAALSDDAVDNMKSTAAAHGFSGEVELNYHLLFFRSGLAAMVGYWLSRGCPETPEELLEILASEYKARPR